jgi:hypothetical protein
MMTPYRAWINQPSTNQPFHHMHGMKGIVTEHIENRDQGPLTLEMSFSCTTKTGGNTLDIVIGAFYEMPDGRITYVHGAGYGKVRHSFDDGTPSAETPLEDTTTWTRRTDLRDYPNASDPRLPYDFDLLWDIKFLSQLRDELTSLPSEAEYILANLFGTITPEMVCAYCLGFNTELLAVAHG